MRRLDDVRWVVGEVGREPIGIAEKLVDQPVSQAWRERAGRYACINPDSDLFHQEDSSELELELEYQSRTGRLYCSWNRSAPRPMKIVSDLEALTYGKTEALRVETEEGKEFIEYSGYRFAKIK